MSFQIDTALVAAYKSNITLLSQQLGSRIRPWVRNETQNAEFEYYDRLDATAATEVTTRHADTPLISTPHDRRRVGLRNFDWADLIDRNDKIRMLADPTASYTQNAVAALGRAMDQVIIDAAFGNAYSGKAGGTTVAWSSYSATNEIAVNYVESGVATNSNLTIAKLRKAKDILGKNEAIADGEPLVAVVSQSQITSLLRTTEVTNSDYNAVKALVSGEVDTFMGFKFVKTELLTVASSIRECIFYAKNGLLLASGSEVMVDVGVRRDKRNSVQVYVCGTFGASRMEEKKVLRVKCDETA